MLEKLSSLASAAVNGFPEKVKWCAANVKLNNIILNAKIFLTYIPQPRWLKLAKLHYPSLNVDRNVCVPMSTLEGHPK